MWIKIEATISGRTGSDFAIKHRRALRGGCINKAYRLEGIDGTSYFAKFNTVDSLSIFSAETEALKALKRSNSIRVPTPVACGTSGNKAYLILEYIDFAKRKNPELMGKQLARLHRRSHSQHGWPQNNYIGITEQKNPLSDDWVDFYREQRLRVQFDMAREKDMHYAGAEQLLEKLDTFFVGYTPEPSMLHGDLWAGNAAYTTNGEPVIFDPASYYGDRETDLAMSELFGGFEPAFYRSYEQSWPLDPGYPQRKPLYQLYHILNHALIFGGGYQSQAQSLIDRLLREL